MLNHDRVTGKDKGKNEKIYDTFDEKRFILKGLYLFFQFCFVKVHQFRGTWVETTDMKQQWENR